MGGEVHGIICNEEKCYDDTLSHLNAVYSCENVDREFINNIASMPIVFFIVLFYDSCCRIDIDSQK